MTEIKNKTKEEMIEKLKKKLHWMTNEASEEEFSIEEWEDTIKLLEALQEDSDKEAYDYKQGVENFWKHKEMREAEENRHLDAVKWQESKAVEQKEQAAEKKRKGKILFFRKKRGIAGTVIAASLVLMLFAGGAIGVSADEDTGFFHWLRRDESGKEWMTVPQSAQATGLQQQVYSTYDEMPEQYKDKVWDKEVLEGDFKLQCIEVVQTEHMVNIVCKYDDDKDGHIEVGMTDYANIQSFQREQYDNYEFLGEEWINGYEAEIYIKENEDGTEYAVYIYADNKKILGQGNIKLEQIIEVVEEYVSEVL